MKYPFYGGDPSWFAVLIWMTIECTRILCRKHFSVRQIHNINVKIVPRVTPDSRHTFGLATIPAPSWRKSMRFQNPPCRAAMIDLPHLPTLSPSHFTSVHPTYLPLSTVASISLPCTTWADTQQVEKILFLFQSNSDFNRLIIGSVEGRTLRSVLGVGAFGRHQHGTGGDGIRTICLGVTRSTYHGLALTWRDLSNHLRSLKARWAWT